MNVDPKTRWKIILRAWPPVGAVFILLSFLVTALWLGHAVTGWPNRELNWLEPLAGILAGTGAFLLAAILIFRRVDSARAQTDTYSLSRGLATGYYFNFLRPLVGALRDPSHTVHAKLDSMGGCRLVGMLIGIPQAAEDFDPARHTALLGTLGRGPDSSFELADVEIAVPGRPRPILAKVVLCPSRKAAIVVDIPTTLSVIVDFAEFFARQELEDAAGADDGVVEARKEIVTVSET
ncbi:MAG: hypothetical protein J0L84_14785, partial [Verrucomicrobia bacterium]|nr:hypothetical protein [Verrucomicrobiota bacterium]